MRDFQVYVEDIIDAIDSIEAYTEGLTYEGFVSDRKTVEERLPAVRPLVVEALAKMKETEHG